MINDVKEKKDRRIPLLIACLIIALAVAVCAVAAFILTRLTLGPRKTVSQLAE